MEPVDLELDERIRSLAGPGSPDAVERVTRGALAAGNARRPVPRAALVSLLVVMVAAGFWWTGRPSDVVPASETGGPAKVSRTETAVELRAGDVVSLTAPDGTTTILSVPGARSSVPPGTAYVISVGGPR